MEELKIICCVPEGGKQGGFQEEVADALRQAGAGAFTCGCRSKQEVEYALFRETGCCCVLIDEEGFPREPYQAWEVAALKDIRMVQVVVLLSRRHYGTPYMDILYTAGILDAVFEEDRDAAMVAGLFLKGRRRRECRGYYGIRSLKETASVLQVMEQERIERYIRYIEFGMDGEDMLARYREVESQLFWVENCCLMEYLPESVLDELRESGEGGKYRLLQGAVS